MRNTAASTLILLSCSAFILGGCVVRTYPVIRDRVDQELSAGNRGFIQGATGEPQERKTTRRTQTVEIELHPWIKFERRQAPTAESLTSQAAPAENTESAGNIGNETTAYESSPVNVTYEKYIVQKTDTLQKISEKFFGTTRQWMKIYEANKDVLKAPNKIYPGQTINIPRVTSTGIPDNLK
jgi:nucleoid-associated protein YgaU